jgi:hypothetical protein
MAPEKPTPKKAIPQRSFHSRTKVRRKSPKPAYRVTREKKNETTSGGVNIGAMTSVAQTAIRPIL